MRIGFRKALGIAGGVVTLVAAWRMLTLSVRDELWGNWPLPLLLGMWIVIVAIFQRQGLTRYLAEASLAGVLLGIAFAPYGAIWAPVLGFMLLLRLLDRAASEEMPKRILLWTGYHAMVLFNVVATWWVANTALAAGIVANFLNAFFQAIVLLLIYQLRRYMPKVWLAGAVVLWLGFEYVHFNWQIAWPWLCLGHTFAAVPVLAQWFSITGVFGGSLYVTLGAALLFHVWVRPARVLYPRDASDPTIAVPNLKEAVKLLVLLLAPHVISVIMWGYAEQTGAPTGRIAAVQPNFEPHYQKFAVSDVDQLERFRDLTDQGLSEGAELVIWPETSFGGVEEDQLEREAWFEAWRELSVSALRQNPRLPALLTGLSTYRVYTEDLGQPALRRQPDGRGDTLYYSAHNSAAAVEEGRVMTIYHKAKLVPGVEFLPYRKALFMFNPLVEQLGGTTVGLGISDSAMVFRYASGIRAAPLICYESLYGDYVREFVQAGANVLVVPTNDGWWDDSPGHRQHFNLARLRAIETRRWVVQAANSGTSGFIDERGRAFAKTVYNTPTVIVKDVQLLDGQTFYVRYGDVLGRLAAGVSVLLLLSLGAKVLAAKRG